MVRIRSAVAGVVLALAVGVGAGWSLTDRPVLLCSEDFIWGDSEIGQSWVTCEDGSERLRSYGLSGV